MANRHGFPIWYELLSSDADASQAFYEKVLGWTVHPADPVAGGMDYRMIDTAGNGGDQNFVGGLMTLTADMTAGGAKPTWLFYLGVDDVDASVAKVTAHGGGVLMPAFDLPGVGRMAFVHDPQGNPFYVMRGASDAGSTAFHGAELGKCTWNELVTPDQAAGEQFYADVFGWSYPDRMPMGPAGDYVFVSVGDTTIGATMPLTNAAAGWRFYFRTPDIEQTAARVAANGGAVVTGPHDIPGGDRMIAATDPDGVVFGAVGPGNR